ncbi:MAG: hypothetical protein QOE87_2648 [Gaiellales bacterium]|nr:hypothetical protein [Gaiellales bacterium]
MDCLHIITVRPKGVGCLRVIRRGCGAADAPFSLTGRCGHWSRAPTGPFASGSQSPRPRRMGFRGRGSPSSGEPRGRPDMATEELSALADGTAPDGSSNGNRAAPSRACRARSRVSTRSSSAAAPRAPMPTRRTGRAHLPALRFAHARRAQHARNGRTPATARHPDDVPVRHRRQVPSSGRGGHGRKVRAP